MQSMCPNCQLRPADTDVEYDEIIGANYRSVAVARGRRARSFSGYFTYGRARLCSRCAAKYRRMVWLRTTGRRAANYGFAALLVSAVLFAILVSAVPAWKTGTPSLIVAAPVALASLVMLGGGALYWVGIVRRPGATRFVTRVSSFIPTPSEASPPAATSSATEGASASPTPPASVPRLSPAERAAARARSRRRRRLTWIGLIAAWIGAVVAALLILTATIWHYSLIPHGVQHFADPLTVISEGWPSRDACTFHDGAYHIAPINNGDGVTCLSPAGGYSDFDLQVTAQVVSGSPDVGYGLAFRAVDGGDEYIFEVTTSGAARVDLVSVGTITPLSPAWTLPGGPLGLGASHLLRVVARGNTFTCFVDNTQVGSLSDNRYSHGAVGLAVSSSIIDVAFTDFTVSAV